MIKFESWAIAALFVWGAGCAHYPSNVRLDHYDYRTGYRFENCTPNQNADDDLFIVLCFSGGGTRAAAFSYGVLEQLRNTPNPADPQGRPLLDKVDVISSVSGGSFTAAYYALRREKTFDDFKSRFLYRDIEGGLVLRALNPVNWWRLGSPSFSRIDLAAEYFDDQIFCHRTFGDLAAAHRRPFLILNSTDMSLGARFEFTQDQFDLLYSDLSSVSVGRGVAASSAFPVLLCPMTINNYAQRPDYVPPPWLNNALGDREISPRRYAHATQVQSYLNPQEKPYIHLIDGGISDNIGLRGIWQSIEYPDVIAPPVRDPRGLNIQRLVNEGKIHKLVVISVNAKPADSDARDLSAATPGLIDVISNISTMPMENYSFDTVELLRQAVEQQQKDGALLDANSPWAKLRMYFTEVSFDGLADPKEKQFLQGLGTNYHLSVDAVDRLCVAGSQILTQSKDFQRLLVDLRGGSASTQPRASTPATQP